MALRARPSGDPGGPLGDPVSNDPGRSNAFGATAESPASTGWFVNRDDPGRAVTPEMLSTPGGPRGGATARGYGGPYPQSWVDTYNQQAPGTQAAIGARYGGMSPDAISADWASNVAPSYAAGTSPEAILGGAPPTGGLQGLIPGTAMGRSSAKAFNAGRDAQRPRGIVNRTLTPELRSRFGHPAAPAAPTTDMPYGGDVTQPTGFGVGGAGHVGGLQGLIDRAQARRGGPVTL